MTVYFSGASISETNGINGAKGDSTGKEVRTCAAYNHKLGWRVFRYPDSKIAYWIGTNAKSIADNNCFGYGQADRVTGYNACKAAGWDPKKVTTKVNIDCSELVRTCIACALEKDITDFNTSSEPSVLLKLGFKEITNWSLSTLQKGDIVCTKTKGHTEVVSTGYTAATTTTTTTTTSTTVAYYNKYTGTSTKVDEVLKAIGVPAAYYGTVLKRKTVATKNGITNYSGTASQNLAIVNLAKQGKLKKV